MTYHDVTATGSGTSGSLDPTEIKQQLEDMLLLYDGLRDSESMLGYADAVLQLPRRVNRTKESKEDVRAVVRGVTSWVSSDLDSGLAGAQLVPQHARAAAARALGGILADV